MREAAAALIGTHDYASFVGAGGSTTSTVRSIYDIAINNQTCTLTGKQLTTITITANGFLYNMARIIVGLLYCIGCGQLPIDSTSNALHIVDRKYTSVVAPGCGLYLDSVSYDGVL
jgi:tRNA pseudouridine38-40 synthase